MQFGLFILALLCVGGVRSDDVCSSSFTAFLQCMADVADKKLGRYVREISPDVKQSEQECFVKNGCEKPNFAEATPSYFLKEPYLTRATDILGVLETVDPKVKDCMMRYLLDILRTKINACVKDNGSDDIKDFEMPPLPDVHNVDVTKFKEVVLDRLMVRTYVQKCNVSKGVEVEKKTIECLAEARSQHDPAMCTARVNCRANNITDPKCRDRFDKVHTTVCECAKKKSKGLGTAGELLMNGKLEKQYKKCHDDNNVPYPADKVKKAHDAVVKTISEVVKNKEQLPEEVKQTLQICKQALSDIEGQWKSAFCADCSQGAKSTDSEIEYLRQHSGS